MRKPSALDSILIRLGTLLANRRSCDALAVLTFHRILPRPDPILASEPDADAFETTMDLVAAHFNALPLEEAVARLQSGRLPARAVCITFDDGYANNCTVALPILAARGLPATVFVAPGFLDGGRMFNDTIIESVRRAAGTLDLRDLELDSYPLQDDSAKGRAIDAIIGALKYAKPDVRASCAASIAARTGLPARSDLMMTCEQVRQLHRAGIGIGAHTVNHPILTSLGSEAARSEIVMSKSRLEAITGAPVTMFAFPNGKPATDYDRTHVDMVRVAGFEAAFTTAWGAADRDCDLFQLPRIAPWGRSPPRYVMQIASSYRERRYARA